MTPGLEQAVKPAAARRTVFPRLRLATVRQYGPFAIALYLIAASKWGSYLVPGPPYIADIALGFLLAERGYSVLRGTARPLPVDAWAALTVGALLAWSLFRLAMSHISIISLRDAAPYLYSITLFVTRAPVSTSATNRTLARVITGAVVFHAAWVSINVLDSHLVNHFPLLAAYGVRIFGMRNDFDGLICGVAATLTLYRASTGVSPAFNLLLFVWNTALVFTIPNRASLVGFVVMLLVLFLLTPARRELARRYAPRVFVTLLLIALPVLYVGAKNGKSVKRFESSLSVVVPFFPATPDVDAAQGTTRARERSWLALEGYLESNPSREIFGVGFGPDFEYDSGALQLLVGGTDTEVRSPHNYLLNTWARLGLVGAALVLAVFMAALRLIRLVARQEHLSDIDMLAILLVSGLPVAATFGVILESPFGALPFFWALGHLSSRAVQLGFTAPAGVQTHRRERPSAVSFPR